MTKSSVQPLWPGVIGEVVLVGIILLGLTAYAHCDTTSNHKGANSLGVVMSNDNPNIYKVGKVVDMGFVSDGKNSGLVVRVQPLATFGLFTEDLLFCDSPTDLFTGKKGPLVLTYRMRAPKAVDGVGCHTLVRVDELAH